MTTGPAPFRFQDSNIPLLWEKDLDHFLIILYIDVSPGLEICKKKILEQGNNWPENEAVLSLPWIGFRSKTGHDLSPSQT